MRPFHHAPTAFAALLALGATAAAQSTAILVNPDPANALRFGDALAVVDLDRDGAKDLVVGAPSGARGRVFVYLGPIAPGATGLLPDLELVSPLSVPGDRFGDGFAVGDVDGDGHDELAIGATRWRGANAEPTGAAFLHDPDDASPWTILLSRARVQTSLMGRTLAIGDFEDAPGLELAVGAPGFAPHHNGVKEGAVHVFSDLKSQPRERVLRNPNPCACGHDQEFGHRIAAGDWNGDGRLDLAVTAIFNDVFVPSLGQAWPGAGQAFVYESPLGGAPAATIDNPDPTTDPFPTAGASCVYQRFGNQVHLADAVHADGFAELTLGAHRKDVAGVCDAGRGFIYTGRTFAFDPTPHVEQLPQTPTDEELFAYRPMFADVVGDGRPDWVVGALSKLEVPTVRVWDAALLQSGGPLGPPTATFAAPSGYGAHFLEGMTAGRLRPNPSPQDKLELVLGDPDAAAFVGRVVVTYW